MAFTSLLVCRDAKAVLVLNRLLQDLGVSVEQSGDLEAAFARVSEQHFDVVVVDCEEQAAAIRLLAHAREASAQATAAIALVSAQTDVREVFASGANFILYKPLSAERASKSLQAARSLVRNERRVSQRIPVDVNAAIAYANKDNINARLVDVSEDGIAILSRETLPLGGRVYFEFSLPGHPATVRLSGEVMWQDGNGRVGIRFVDVPKSSRRAVDEWLKANVSRRPEMEVSLSPSDKKQGGLNGSLVAGLQLLSASTADRRNRSRHVCSIGAEVNRPTSAVPYRVLLTDLSDGGCYVQTTEPFPVGTPVEVMVWSNDEKLRLPARVQSVHPGLGMGLQFALKTEAQRQQVRQLLVAQAARPDLSFQKR